MCERGGKRRSVVTDACRRTTSNHYLLGYGKEPTACVKARRGEGPAESPETVRLWYSDYHPDGGQLFFPEDGQPFVTNLAPPLGDEPRNCAARARAQTPTCSARSMRRASG